MGIDTELLRSFAVLAEEGHVGRAASRLFLSQPALSKRLRRLEAEVGVRLIEPAGRGIAITDAGRVLADASTDVLAVLDEAIGNARAAARSAEAVIVVGFVAPMPSQLTTSLLDAESHQGQYTVILSEIDWSQPVAAVTSGAADVVLARGPIDTDDDTIATEVVYVEPRVAAVSQRHPLAGAKSTQLSHYDADPVVVTAPETDYWIVDPRPGGVRPVRGPQASSVAELLEIIASGKAMAFPAKSMGLAYSRADIAYVPVADITPSTVVAIWSRSSRLESLPDLLGRIRDGGAAATAADANR